MVGKWQLKYETLWISQHLTYYCSLRHIGIMLLWSIDREARHDIGTAQSNKKTQHYSWEIWLDWAIPTSFVTGFSYHIIYTKWPNSQNHYIYACVCICISEYLPLYIGRILWSHFHHLKSRREHIHIKTPTYVFLDKASGTHMSGLTNRVCEYLNLIRIRIEEISRKKKVKIIHKILENKRRVEMSKSLSLK